MTTPDYATQFKCRLCRESGLFPVYTVREMMYGSREPFDYVHCHTCGCLQILEIPSDLGRHYPADYYSQMPRSEPPDISGPKGALIRWYCRSAVLRPNSLLEAVLQKRLPMPTDFAEYGRYLINAHLANKSTRILDVGCGTSPHRLAAFRRCGFSAVEGIDPFIPADCTYYGIPVYRRTIEQVEGEFAFIMFHHSLEHVPDPISALRAAAKLLQPGGTCLVRIPVMSTCFWRTFGVHWAELDAPRHLYLMSVQTVAMLAQATGLRLRKTEFDSEGWELAASHQYQSDIPLRDARSFAGGGASDMFNTEHLQAFEAEAAELNRAGDAGRACFYLDKL